MYGDSMRDLVLGKLGGKAVQEPFVSDAEIQYTRSQMTDMEGPLSYYRTTKYRFDEEAGEPGMRLSYTAN